MFTQMLPTQDHLCASIKLTASAAAENLQFTMGSRNSVKKLLPLKAFNPKIEKVN